MSREILFKAKRLDNCEWVRGGTIVQFLDNGIRSFYMPQFNEKCNCTHDDVTDDILGFENCRFYKVDAATICQYTGLTDKNGKKIWENDILKTNNGRICKVVWFSSPQYQEWDLFPLESVDPAPSKSNLWSELEVMGNIFDNPELLKGDKFIVEIKEKFNSEKGTLYRCNFNTLTFDDNGLDKLEKVDKPIPIRIEQAQEWYNKGLEDAWKLARKFYQNYRNGELLSDEAKEIFLGFTYFNSILTQFTPQEALTKLEAYEKEHEIKVGDVVTTINGKCGYIVTNVQLPNTVHCINSRNGFTLQMKISSLKKTGKHIDISNILEQIKEN